MLKIIHLANSCVLQQWSKLLSKVYVQGLSVLVQACVSPPEGHNFFPNLPCLAITLQATSFVLGNPSFILTYKALYCHMTPFTP